MYARLSIHVSQDRKSGSEVPQGSVSGPFLLSEVGAHCGAQLTCRPPVPRVFIGLIPAITPQAAKATALPFPLNSDLEVQGIVGGTLPGHHFKFKVTVE